MSEEKQYTYDELFDQIIEDIIENKSAVRNAIKGRMSTMKFYELLEDESKAKRYARATEIRADKMAEETIQIADSVGEDVIVLEDGREVVNHNVINRDRLRVDTRKWLMAKMYPKKFGEKVDLSSSDGTMTPKVIDLSQLSTEELLLRANATNKLKEY